MKKLVLLLALFGTASALPQLLSARPAAAHARHQAAPTYQQGWQDGMAYAAQLDARYGAGTDDYNTALAAAETRADRNIARNDSDRSYWQGYRDGLQDY